MKSFHGPGARRNRSFTALLGAWPRTPYIPHKRGPGLINQVGSSSHPNGNSSDRPGPRAAVALASGIAGGSRFVAVVVVLWPSNFHVVPRVRVRTEWVYYE